MGFPAASTIVETVGTSPCTICVESWTTTSEARLTTRPTPPTIGNINAATSIPARTQATANLASVFTVVGVARTCRQPRSQARGSVGIVRVWGLLFGLTRPSGSACVVPSTPRGKRRGEGCFCVRWPLGLVLGGSPLCSGPPVKQLR